MLVVPLLVGGGKQPWQEVLLRIHTMVVHTFCGQATTMIEEGLVDVCLTNDRCWQSWHRIVLVMSSHDCHSKEIPWVPDNVQL